MTSFNRKKRNQNNKDCDETSRISIKPTTTWYWFDFQQVNVFSCGTRGRCAPGIRRAPSRTSNHRPNTYLRFYEKYETHLSSPVSGMV